MIEISKVNESFLHIEGDYEDKLALSEYFSKFAPNYYHQPKYKIGQWDGKIKFFNLATGNLPYGLLDMLYEAIEAHRLEANFSPVIDLDQEPKPIDEAVWKMVLDNFQRYKPFEHQIIGARELIINRRGLLEHATSSGKTLTLFLFLDYILRKLNAYIDRMKIMVVVPTKGLIVQFTKDFEYYGLNPKLIGKYYSDEKDLSKPITVGTWQSLQKVDQYLNGVHIVVADEVHQAKAHNIKTLIEKCRNTKFRVGVTGSLPTEECDLLSVIGTFGRILHEVHTDELIQKDIVSKIEVIQVQFNYPKGTSSMVRKNYGLEKDVIQQSRHRLETVEKLIARHKKGENILLLFDELEFGSWYFDELQKNLPDRQFYYVSGDVDVQEREKIRVFANENENVVIVASLGTFSTGINIPRLHSVIGLWLGKSTIKLRQVIGRGLRKHVSKDRFLFWDIADQLPYTKRHSIERMRVYFQEGFPVRSIEVHPQ